MAHPREVEQFLHAEIPLTRAMQVRVLQDEKGACVVEAPVAANSNHLRTAFGGSINAVATLAGYAFLWNELRASVHVVIRDSTIRFRRPVREVIRAVCAPPEPAAWQSFRDALAAQGKASIALSVRVEEAEALAAEFTGTFVALRRDRPVPNSAR